MTRYWCKCITQERPCLTTFPNTENRVEKTLPIFDELRFAHGRDIPLPKFHTPFWREEFLRRFRRHSMPRTVIQEGYRVLRQRSFLLLFAPVSVSVISMVLREGVISPLLNLQSGGPVCFPSPRWLATKANEWPSTRVWNLEFVLPGCELQLPGESWFSGASNSPSHLQNQSSPATGMLLIGTWLGLFETRAITEHFFRVRSSSLTPPFGRLWPNLGPEELRGVWKCGQTLFWVFVIFSQSKL